MSPQELASRTAKIFEMAKLIAMHVDYLPPSERDKARSTVADCLSLTIPAKTMSAATGK